jgi:hypothetical protein
MGIGGLQERPLLGERDYWTQSSDAADAEAMFEAGGASNDVLRAHQITGEAI